MCGIIGYIGRGDSFPAIDNGLRKLEYRGYDSFGFATSCEGKLHVEKSVGKISRSKLKPLPGRIGIGHSRWATHGGVTVENFYPHTDCMERIAIVHNGIIENYQSLKRDLIETGHLFRSETDSEIIAHLIEENMELGFEEAVKAAVRRLHGRYAVVAISRDGDKLIGVRRGSPLIVGVGEGEFFMASDIPAFLERTKRVMYLDDEEIAVISERPTFRSLKDDRVIDKRVVEIEWDAKQAEKGEYPHFMIKEIMEQKETIQRAINQDEKEITDLAGKINGAYGTFFTGCGTAGRVCLAGEYMFSRVARKHVNFVVSSEFPNYQHFLTDRTLVIAISQSGETADVLEAMSAAKEKGSTIISLVNVMGSSIERESDHSLLTKAGPEKAVASTKATTAQLALVTLLAYASAGRLDEGKRLLAETAARVNDMLNPRYEDRIRKLAGIIKDNENIYIIGRSLNYPMALEAAIKIQEVSYIHAEGFAGGELKHGPIALIGKGTPCIALVANDEVRSDMISNIMEIKARGGYIIGVAPENNEVFDYWIKVPDVGNASPIVNIIPVQMLAYHLGLLRGCDVDCPRNLAKSVVVK